MTDLRSLSRAIAAVLLALVPAYCSVDGLITGETLAIDKRRNFYTGTAALVTAISYGLLAAALMIAASTYAPVEPKRRKTLAKTAWHVTVVAAVLFFAGRIVAVLQ